MASAVASATAVMAAASPWALLISACFSPSERAMKGLAHAGGDVDLFLRRAFSEAAISARFALGSDLGLHRAQDFGGAASGP